MQSLAMLCKSSWTASIVGGLIADSSKDALTKIRNEAAELGGDVVYTVSETGGNFSGVSITAEVYKKVTP